MLADMGGGVRGVLWADLKKIIQWGDMQSMGKFCQRVSENNKTIIRYIYTYIYICSMSLYIYIIYIYIYTIYICIEIYLIIIVALSQRLSVSVFESTKAPGPTGVRL